jgi:hypothetical protein
MNKKIWSVCQSLATTLARILVSVIVNINPAGANEVPSFKSQFHIVRGSAVSLALTCPKKLAQNPVPGQSCPEGSENTPDANADVTDILNQLNDLPKQKFFTSNNSRTLSPGLTISSPSGFGADNNTVFLVVDYQGRTRYSRKGDGEVGVGVALGDARKAVGVELSYTQDSFGRNGQTGGGFNIRVHRRISDSSSVAVGWNHFAVIESRSGYLDYPKNSYYAVYTQIFKTREYLEQLFSRVAVTTGIGSGQFLHEAEASGRDPNGLNLFGTVAVRVAQPVSAIVEWTGQDLAMGLSISPFKNLPIVITPGFRDIAGAGDGARFVLGTGVSFQF